MPLSAPAARRHIHTRTVTCQGFRREDGLWDIEGHMTDVKTYAFGNEWRGEIAPGEPLHDMWMRLTIDDGFTVHAVEAVTDASPYQVCPSITPNYQRLVGLKLTAGWRRAVAERLGGPQGCTHLVELLGPMATTAFQTLYPILSKERRERGGAPADSTKPPALLDSCHAFAADGEITRKAWPQWARTKAE